MTYEREAVEARLHDRLDEAVRELAEAKKKLADARALIDEFRGISMRAQRALNSLAKALGEPTGLRPVPGMAVWNAAEAEKR